MSELLPSGLLDGVTNSTERSFRLKMTESRRHIPERSVLDVFCSHETAEAFCEKWPHLAIIYPCFTGFFTSTEPAIAEMRDKFFANFGGLGEGVTFLACKEEIWLFFKTDVTTEIGKMKNELEAESRVIDLALESMRFNDYMG